MNNFYLFFVEFINLSALWDLIFNLIQYFFVVLIQQNSMKLNDI